MGIEIAGLKPVGRSGLLASSFVLWVPLWKPAVPVGVGLHLLGIQGRNVMTMLATTDDTKKVNHKHHNPATLQPSLIVSDSLMDR